MSDTPIADALKKIDIPDVEEGLDVRVEATKDDQGVTVDLEHDIGKPGGWSYGASGGYWRHAKGKVVGWLKWRPGK